MKTLSVHRAEFLAFALAAFLVSAGGYFVYFGRQTALTHSWKYAIADQDEYGFWAYADGASESPSSAGNPYFYEERGRRPVIPYPVPEAAGLLARFFRVSVLFFFPLWHIGMPALVFMSLYYCLRRVWHYPFTGSFIAALVVPLSSLFLTGRVSFTLLGFPQPGDYLWAVFFWLSYVLNFRENYNRRTAACGFLAFIGIWLNPFLFLLCMLITAGELAWQQMIGKNQGRVRRLFGILGSGAAGFLCWAAYVHAHWQPSQWTERSAALRDALLLRSELPSLALFLTSAAAVVLSSWRRSKDAAQQLPWINRLTRLDRLFLMTSLTAMILGNLRHAPGVPARIAMEMAEHIDSLYVIYVLAAAGWIFEKMKRMKLGTPKVQIAALAGSAVAVFFISRSPGSENPSAEFGVISAAVLFAALLPVTLLACALLFRIKNVFRKRTAQFVCAVLLVAFGLSGYRYCPLPKRESPHRFPYDGAYGWLNANAKPGEVVLTPDFAAPALDYLIFYTPLKIYDSYFGQQLSIDPAVLYRHRFTLALLNGVLLDMPLENATSLTEKLSRYRLDYILLPSESSSAEVIVRDLAGHLDEVYRDGACILWRVHA